MPRQHSAVAPRVFARACVKRKGVSRTSPGDSLRAARSGGINAEHNGLWSVDLARCESLILKTHWVMVVMDQFTRRIIGFAVQAGTVCGPTLCRMFNHVVAGEQMLPQHLSSDHDPLFEFHRWKPNLRILDVTEDF